MPIIDQQHMQTTKAVGNDFDSNLITLPGAYGQNLKA